LCDYPFEWSIKKEYLVHIKRQVSYIAVGSTIYHGSNTILGEVFDQAHICLFAYLLHAAAIDNVGKENGILSSMWKYSRGQSAVDIS